MKSLSVAIFTMSLLTYLVILPSYVFSNKETILFSGQKWKFIRVADEKIYGFNVFEVKSSKAGFNKNSWVVKGQRLYRYYQSETVIDTYTEKISFRLSEDYKLLYLDAEIKKNGQVDEKWSIQYKNHYYDYKHNLLGLEQFTHKRVPTQKPLYFYDVNYPWTAEILLKSRIIYSVPCITFEGAETVDLSPEKEAERPEQKVFLVNEKSRILVAPDFTVLQIQTSDNKVIRKTQQEVSDLNIEARRLNIDIPCNVRFIRPELLSYLHIKIKDGINFSESAKLIDQLESPRQLFKGIAENGHIEGEVFITAKLNPPGERILFPVTRVWEPNLAEYLTKEKFIESDNFQIINKAKEITAESKTIGEAARSITGWVHKNIQGQESTTRSALETLNNRKGVCLHFSRLTVALCRAVNIPARCIIGIVNLGENFIYHEWVEIYYGQEDGWIAMDPGLGQIGFVDASHIGLSNTDINWQSPDDEKTLEVLDYQPRSVTPVINENKVNMRGIWQKYQSFEYDFLEAGKVTGSYSAKFDMTPEQQLLLMENFEIPSKLIQLSSQLALNELGYAIHYKSSGQWQGKVYGSEAVYGKQIFQKFIIGEQSFQKSVARIGDHDLQAEGYSFFEWGLVLTRLIDGVEDKGKADKRLTVYMPDIQRYMNIDVTIEPVEIDFLGVKTDGMECSIMSFPYSRHLLITKEGIITQLEIPEIGVVVALKRVNPRI